MFIILAAGRKSIALALACLDTSGIDRAHGYGDAEVVVLHPLQLLAHSHGAAHSVLFVQDVGNVDPKDADDDAIVHAFDRAAELIDAG